MTNPDDDTSPSTPKTNPKPVSKDPKAPVKIVMPLFVPGMDWDEFQRDVAADASHDGGDNATFGIAKLLVGKKPKPSSHSDPKKPVKKPDPEVDDEPKQVDVDQPGKDHVYGDVSVGKDNTNVNIHLLQNLAA